MANKLVEQKIVDSTNRALIKYVIIPDGSTTANTTLIDVSCLAYALNTKGYIMTSNTDPKTKYNTTIKRIYGFAKANGAGYSKLQWEGDSNSEIVTVGSGWFDFNFDAQGFAASIPNPEVNSTGDILLTLVNPSVSDALTVFVDLKKDAKDYDAGQTADPAAFNKGKWSL